MKEKDEEYENNFYICKRALLNAPAGHDIGFVGQGYKIIFRKTDSEYTIRDENDTQGYIFSHKDIDEVAKVALNIMDNGWEEIKEIK